MLYCWGTLLKGSGKIMTVKKFINKMLCHSCCYFTVCMLVYIIIAAIINVDYDTLLLDAGRTVLFFVFSLLLALANVLLTLERPSAKFRILLHFLITAFAFYACFMLPLSMRASSILVGLVIFTILYFAILATVTALKAKYRSNTEKSQKYEKQYSKK